MKRPRSRAAKRTLSLWADAPLSARMHTTVRAWTAPFEALEVQVPASGSVLEVGCGHGLFTTFLALSSTNRDVVGIDIDEQKIALAKKTASRLSAEEGTISFQHRHSGDLPDREGGWDAIVFADVLYLLQPENRSQLLRDCAEALSPGGVLIVKEVDTEPKLKAMIAQFQEFLATRIFRITHGDEMDFLSAVELADEMRSAGLATRLSHLDKGYFHPHCVVVGTKPSVD